MLDENDSAEGEDVAEDGGNEEDGVLDLLVYLEMIVIGKYQTEQKTDWDADSATALDVKTDPNGAYHKEKDNF